MDLKWKEVKREKGQTSAGVRNGEVTELNVFAYQQVNSLSLYPVSVLVQSEWSKKWNPFIIQFNS